MLSNDFIARHSSLMSQTRSKVRCASPIRRARVPKKVSTASKTIVRGLSRIDLDSSEKKERDPDCFFDIFQRGKICRYEGKIFERTNCAKTSQTVSRPAGKLTVNRLTTWNVKLWPIKFYTHVSFCFQRNFLLGDKLGEFFHWIFIEFWIEEN